MTERAKGMDRREFLRRSAIVGGTVAWMTPVIQSLTPPAFGHEVGSLFFCCDCKSVSGTGANPCNQCSNSPTTSAACATFCAGLSSATRTCGTESFHSSASPITCSGGNCDATHDST
ncbi:MAG: hypothetical protein ACRDHM_11665 [Actinomycetota bacterium]